MSAIDEYEPRDPYRGFSVGVRQSRGKYKYWACGTSQDHMMIVKAQAEKDAIGVLMNMINEHLVRRPPQVDTT